MAISIFALGGFTTLGLAVLVIAFTGYAIHQVFFHPLSDIPGPFLAKLTRWWQAYEVFSGAAEVTERALHEKYGKPKCTSIGANGTIDAHNRLPGARGA